jgi:poly(3-hydroxybutyrate) depolymerase
LIYAVIEATRRLTRPMYRLLEASHKLARDEANPLRDTVGMRTLAGIWELQARALKTYEKPRYLVWEALGEQEIELEEQVVQSLPFADLLRFPMPGSEGRPKVLIAAALSGHHATLLQDTVRGFAQNFDTYITDWRDARQVPLDAGEFGFDDYVEHLIRFLETLGPDTHVVATCQAAPPAMVAAAVMAMRKSPSVPASLTLMGGPVDTRLSPNNLLNKITTTVPLDLFKKLNIHKVPAGYPGVGRRVYPGFLQLNGFMTLNPKPHIQQHYRFLKNSVAGDDDALEKFRDFYDEYFAVLDMAELFYIETLEKVFFDQHIAKGKMTFRGEKVDFASVRDIALLTVEGANDNFCPPTQTEAAHDVFTGLPPEKRGHYLQPGVGHYGVFSGSKFQAEIYPVIRNFIFKTIDQLPNDHEVKAPPKPRAEPVRRKRGAARPDKAQHHPEGSEFEDIPFV